VPDHLVSSRPTEDPDLLPIVPEFDPLPEPRRDPIAEPSPELPVEEDIEPEPARDRSELVAAPRLPDPGVIGIGGGRLPGGRLRPRAPEPTGPATVRRPARVVTRGGLRFRLQDVGDGSPGTLRLGVKLGPDGRVRHVVVRRRSGVVSFDDSVLASVEHWGFEPATIDGEAVASEIEIRLRPARLRSMEKPEYPPRAIELGLEGVARLAAVVGADGRVSSVKVLESSGAALLDRAATAAVKRWTFSPARVNGRPAACTVEIRPIRFELR
jgi:TonB family protein